MSFQPSPTSPLLAQAGPRLFTGGEPCTPLAYYHHYCLLPSLHHHSQWCLIPLWRKGWTRQECSPSTLYSHSEVDPSLTLTFTYILDIFFDMPAKTPLELNWSSRTELFHYVLFRGCQLSGLFWSLYIFIYNYFYFFYFLAFGESSIHVKTKKVCIHSLHMSIMYSNQVCQPGTH